MMFKLPSGLYSCKEHPTLEVGPELAAAHLRSEHAALVALVEQVEVSRVPVADRIPRMVTGTASDREKVRDRRRARREARARDDGAAAIARELDELEADDEGRR
jgi:hypothetical protein